MHLWRWAHGAFISLVISLVLVAPAAAQSSPEITTQLSAEAVEVDEAVTLEIRVTREGGEVPSQPSLAVPEGFTVFGPHTFRSSFGLRGPGGSRSQEVFSARWQLVAKKPGTYQLPAPAVVVDGQKMAGASLTLRVVEAGAKARDRRKGFGGLGGFFSGPQTRLDIDLRDFFPDPQRDLTPSGEELSLARAPDPHIFLRIIPDKTEAVVGEQITLGYWVYARGMILRHGQPREPSLVDFARMELDPPRKGEQRTRVGGQLWGAQQFHKIAIFPLRAGKLSTGQVELDVVLPGLGQREITRRSNDVVIDVREPPKEDRPAGYVLGDVGRFKLAATVSPHETFAGETVSVVVKVTGFGQLPHKLGLPKRAGVEWLTPEKREQIDEHDGRVGGWRSFGYAVRFSEPGSHDLGVIELPHYDPTRSAYEVARAELGTVRVKPKPNAQQGKPLPGEQGAPTADEPAPLTTLGGPRTTLGAFERRRDDGLDPRWLWSLALAPPLAVVGGGFVARAFSTLRRRRRERRDDPAVLARQALIEAEAAGDAKDSAAAAERALHLAIEARTSIKARGVLLGELEGKLRERGLSSALAQDTAALLERLGTVRFAPSDEESADLGQRAAKLVDRLLAH